jgi:hypothetical protein
MRSLRADRCARMDRSASTGRPCVGCWRPRYEPRRPYTPNRGRLPSSRTWTRSDACRIGPSRFSQRAHLDRGGHALDVFTSPEFNVFYDASTLIVICAKPAGPFVVADCWLAAANLMLAASAMGLGTCVIGSAVPALNTRDVKADIGIPAEFSAIAPIIVGVPRGVTPPTTRKAPHVLTWR